MPASLAYIGSLILPLQQPASRTFPETGKTVSGKFLQYWDGHGGLPQQGYPISSEMQEVSQTDGRTYTVQYFERSVFEFHPENQPPNDVLLSLLGVFMYKQKYPSGAPNQTPDTGQGSVLFEQTGHRLGGVFYNYWQTRGGLPQQGYPISDPFWEKSDLDGKMYIVQYFERAVFELHSENAGTPHEVLLSQLGTFRLKVKETPPTATPVETNWEEGREIYQGNGWKMSNSAKGAYDFRPTNSAKLDEIRTLKNGPGPLLEIYTAENRDELVSIVGNLNKDRVKNGLPPLDGTNLSAYQARRDDGTLVTVGYMQYDKNDTSRRPLILYFFKAVIEQSNFGPAELEKLRNSVIQVSVALGCGGHGQWCIPNDEATVLSLFNSIAMTPNN